MIIKIVVDPKRFDEFVSIEDWLNFNHLTNREIYQLMLHFVVDEKKNPLPEEKARQLFKNVPKKDFHKYTQQFIKAINEAYVNPTTGGGSSSPSKAEQQPPPDG